MLLCGYLPITLLAACLACFFRCAGQGNQAQAAERPIGLATTAWHAYPQSEAWQGQLDERPRVPQAYVHGGGDDGGTRAILPDDGDSFHLNSSLSLSAERDPRRLYDVRVPTGEPQTRYNTEGAQVGRPETLRATLNAPPVSEDPIDEINRATAASPGAFARRDTSAGDPVTVSVAQ